MNVNKPMKYLALSLTALLATASLAGCTGSGSGSGSNSGAGAKGATVSIKSTKYSPDHLEIAAGTTVTWTNDDPTDHSVWEGDPDGQKHLFHTADDLQPKQSYSYKFDKPGTYQIYCNTAAHYLLNMKMQVVVK